MAPATAAAAAIGWTRASALFGRWTPAILLATVNDAYSGFYSSNAGEGFDLIWSMETLIWIVTAATWRPLGGERDAGVRRTVDRTVYLLPLVVACFSLVLSLGLCQRRLGMGLGLMAVALGGSAARWLGRRRLARQRADVPSTGAAP